MASDNCNKRYFSYLKYMKIIDDSIELVTVFVSTLYRRTIWCKFDFYGFTHA